MNTALIGALGAALSFLLTAVLGWIQRSQAQTTGARLEAAAQASVVAHSQAAIAQAVTDAPRTQAEVVKALLAEEF